MIAIDPRLLIMTYTRLIYASIARENLHISELLQIRKRSKTHNAENGVTGMLCYGNGYFLQWLEGTRAEVNALYARILHDTRHSDVEILSYTSVRKREFSEWTMKMISIDEPFAAHRRAVLAAHSKGLRFEPLAISNRRAMGLLRAFAKVEREHAASLDDRVIQD